MLSLRSSNFSMVLSIKVSLFMQTHLYILRELSLVSEKVLLYHYFCIRY